MKIPGAIVAASDCRITGKRDTFITGQIQHTETDEKKAVFGKPEELKPQLDAKEPLHTDEIKIPFGYYDFVKTDTEKKTFLFTNKENHSFAISYCGQANLNGYPTSYRIQELLKKMGDISSTIDIAECFKKYWVDEGIAVKPNLLISGYNSGKASVLELQGDGMTIQEHHEADGIFGITYHGEQDVIKALVDLGNYQWSLFRLQDAIDFCSLMITTTARIQSFQSTQQTVSEKHDILVVTTDTSKWIRRDTIDLE